LPRRMKISPPSSQSSQSDDFPLRGSIGEDFLPFCLALCGSKPSSQRSQRDDFPLRHSTREDFLPFSCSLCSLWLKTEFTEVTERLFSSQMQHTQGFPSILSCSLCSLALCGSNINPIGHQRCTGRGCNLSAARKRFWQGIASVAALLRNDVLQTVRPLVDIHRNRFISSAQNIPQVSLKTGPCNQGLAGRS